MSTIQTKAVFPDLETYVKTLKENPELFNEIIDEHSKKISKKIYRESKEKGIPVTYRDNEYPGCLIQEEADGRRYIIKLNPDKSYATEIVREIPPRKPEKED